eukprot:SAG31_NODE_1053_length_10144_cov_117.540866_3_plen_117_part_00
MNWARQIRHVKQLLAEGLQLRVAARQFLAVSLLDSPAPLIVPASTLAVQAAGAMVSNPGHLMQQVHDIALLLVPIQWAGERTVRQRKTLDGYDRGTIPGRNSGLHSGSKKVWSLQC